MAEINELVMKRGDTDPAFEAQLLDGAEPVDLTGASAIKLLIQGHTPKDLTTLPTVGWVRYQWLAEDLVELGEFRLEVEVIWSPTKRRTFPAEGQHWLRVVKDLG